MDSPAVKELSSLRKKIGKSKDFQDTGNYGTAFIPYTEELSIILDSA
jgi:hypothetical protein